MITTADKRGVLPRFRLPEDNTLLPACLVIDGELWLQWRDGNLARVCGGGYERTLERGTLLAFIW